MIMLMSETFSPVVAATLARLDEFTEEELLHLNRLIVERIRLMHQVKAHRAMTQFRVGQRVQFISRAGRTLTGVLTKYNRKSVSVVTEDGESWTVAPSLLRAVS
jgi:hypothetical protein